MKIIYSAILFIVCLFYSNSINSQNSQRLGLIFSYGLDLPGGDLADRFGINYNPGLDIDYFQNEKWFFGIHGHMLIGPIVKEDVISNIRTSDGGFVSQQQDLAVITMKQRGFLVGIHGGRFIKLNKGKNKHGIRLRLGSSIMTHYIIFNNETASTNQLLGDYTKGYDRLTRGITLEEFIGYQYINESGSLNTFIGFNFVHGFNKNLRPYDFDTRIRDEARKFDQLFGIRVGFTINLYETGKGEEVYY